MHKRILPILMLILAVSLFWSVFIINAHAIVGAAEPLNIEPNESFYVAALNPDDYTPLTSDSPSPSMSQMPSVSPSQSVLPLLPSSSVSPSPSTSPSPSLLPSPSPSFKPKPTASPAVTLAYDPSLSSEISAATPTEPASTTVSPSPEAVPSTTSKQIPILMYHHFVRDGEPVWNAAKSESAFRADIEALLSAGFTPVFAGDLVGYVYSQAELPEKPVMITIDDGYQSNYDIAFPVLKELNAKATISVIGWSIGLSEAPERRATMLPHFSKEAAKEMYLSGLVDIQNHTHDMHDLIKNGATHDGVRINNDEPLADYQTFIDADSALMNDIFLEMLGHSPTVFTYPFGKYTSESEKILRQLGYRVTLTLGSKFSTIVQGEPSSLFGLNRINVDENLTGAVLVEEIVKIMKK